jgi:AraC-like DNA-binding protein
LTAKHDDGLVAQLRQVLLLSAGHAPTLEQAAKALHLSKRSLNRALARVGWKFTDVIACYRRDVAIALLKTNETTIKEIAAVVGYSDPDSLRRAFREWTGMSIVDWSRKHTGVAPPRSSLLSLAESA